MRGIKRIGFIVLALAVIAAGTIRAYPQQSGDVMLSVFWRCAGLERKTTQVEDHKIAYLEGGTGEPIVLVHGFGGDKGNWAFFAYFLTKHYHVVAPDLPAFGESSYVDGSSYDFPNQTERLHKFITQMDLGKVNLAGNSMGGGICGLYAARYPEEVATLALIDAAGVAAPQQSDLNKLLAKGQNPLVVNQASDYDKLLELNFDNPPLIPLAVKNIMIAQALSHQAAHQKIFTEITDQFTILQPELKKIKCPVLIVWGNHDRLIHPSSAQVFKQELRAPNEVVIIKNAGHLPMTEKPKETALIYLDFLNNNLK